MNRIFKLSVLALFLSTSCGMPVTPTHDYRPVFTQNENNELVFNSFSNGAVTLPKVDCKGEWPKTLLIPASEYLEDWQRVVSLWEMTRRGQKLFNIEQTNQNLYGERNPLPSNKDNAKVIVYFNSDAQETTSWANCEMILLAQPADRSFAWLMVRAHELGHTIGFSHSSSPYCIMWGEDPAPMPNTDCDLLQ